MAEKANENDDPGGGGGVGGDGGGIGGGLGGGGGEGGGGGYEGGVTLTDEDAGFDQYVDAYNDANKSGHELNDPSDNDPADPNNAKKHVAPPAPPVDHNAPIGTTTNPIHSRTGGL